MKFTKKIKTLLQFLFGIILLIGILSKVNFHEVGNLFLHIEWKWVIFAFLIIILLRVLMALRWQILLTSQNIHVSLRELIWITFVSFFFGVFLPGGVGVDIAKGYHLVNLKGKTSKVAATLILDHFIGLLTMLFVAFLGTLPGLLNGQKNSFSLPVFLAFCALLAGWIIGYYIVLKLDLSKRTVSKNELINKIFNGFCKILNAITDLKKIRSVFIPLFSLAVLVILFRCFLFYCFYRALLAQVSIISCIMIIPLVYVVMLLPLTAGGIGIREGALAFFFLPLGIPAEISVGVGLLSHIVQLFSSLIGLFFWVKGKKDNSLKVKT